MVRYCSRGNDRRRSRTRSRSRRGRRQKVKDLGRMRGGSQGAEHRRGLGRERRRRGRATSPRRRRSLTRGASRDYTRERRQRSRQRRRGGSQGTGRNRRIRSRSRSRNRADNSRRRTQQESRHKRRVISEEANPFLEQKEEGPEAQQNRGQGVSAQKKESQFPFPTDQNGEFARAMSTIACNAGAATKGIFSKLSGGEENFRNQLTQALALQLNFNTTQQANEKALFDL